MAQPALERGITQIETLGDGVVPVVVEHRQLPRQRSGVVVDDDSAELEILVVPKDEVHVADEVAFGNEERVPNGLGPPRIGVIAWVEHVVFGREAPLGEQAHLATAASRRGDEALDSPGPPMVTPSLTRTIRY